jgi:TolB-like protein/Tfp pilus assembly protein PilF
VGHRDEDDRLEELAAAAADGLSIDATIAASNESSAELVRELEVIARIARLNRSPSPPSQPRRAAGADPIAHWGPLRILREVGRGSFGRVFHATDPRLGRDVALKLFDTVAAETAATVVPEARALAQVRHENVVTVFGADHFDGAVGVWMEFVDGRTLRDICVGQGPFSAPEALLIGLDVCRALAAVHRAGFVHGDIKAQNVMRQIGGRIVLADFGAARLIKYTDERRRISVTPYYAAPEVLFGSHPDQQSDVYSVGVLLYFLVTGRFPVEGEASADIRHAHRAGSRTRLRDLRPDLPPSFIRVVDAATSTLRDDRPLTAGALEDAIESAMGRAVTTSSWRREGGPPAEPEASIVVLPFADMSADASLAYFGAGVAEEIIDALAGIRGVRVIPRASAFAASRDGADVQHLGGQLNVRTILQGSVRADGSQLRVTARLTDATSGVQLWAETYRRELSNLFGVQDEIAAAVCGELGVRLRPHHRPAGGASDERNPEAYTLYLKGRYFWNQRTEPALQKSVTYLQAATVMDPDNAAAHAALAEATATLGLYGALPPHQVMPRARTAAQRAVELAPESAGAHATNACIAAVYDWDWQAAARDYLRAMEFNPDEPSAHHWYAINYLVPLGRFEQAGTELQLAAVADPLSRAIRDSFGMRSYFMHDFARADREFRAALETDSASGTARLFLGLTLVELTRFDEAIGEIESARQVTGSPETLAALAYAAARAGYLDRARELLGTLLAQAESRYVSASLIAQVHAASGSLDGALEWLERAMDARAADLAWLHVRPVFDGLRAEPRFHALAARLNLR